MPSSKAISTTRRRFLASFGLGGAALFAGQAPRKRPNVVILLTDDQGALDANCYGSKDLFTPNMDALAERGVRFTRAYAHTVCCPARALLLTGRQPQRSGVVDWIQGDMKGPRGRNMSLKEVTLAEALKAHGYETALFGKWHLGAAADSGPTRQGFDLFYGFRDGFIDKYNHYFLHGKGFHDLYKGTQEVWEPGVYFPDIVVRESLRFLEENRDRPFFLYAAFGLPHYPEQADKKFTERYKDLPMPRRSYAAVVSTVDDRMGRILKKIDELGLRDNTIIVFASDNGYSIEDYSISVDNHASGYPKGHYYGAHHGGGNTGKWRGNKDTFFEGGLLVPAIVSYPDRLPWRAVRHQAISIADFYPTVLELCGIPLPRQAFDGKSLLPVLRSPEAPSPHPVMHWQWQDRWAVLEGDWKLIDDHKNKGIGEEQIFLGNLADAQPERKNYAHERPEIVQHLRQLHERWLAEVEPR